MTARQVKEGFTVCIILNEHNVFILIRVNIIVSSEQRELVGKRVSG